MIGVEINKKKRNIILTSKKKNLFSKKLQSGQIHRFSILEGEKKSETQHFNTDNRAITKKDMF